jgi:hypothetical protein
MKLRPQHRIHARIVTLARELSRDGRITDGDMDRARRMLEPHLIQERIDQRIAQSQWRDMTGRYAGVQRLQSQRKLHQ